MVHTIRKALAGLLLLGAFAGLLPMLPNVFGYYSAVVTNDSAGTYFPAASATPPLGSRYIECNHVQSPLVLQKNKTNPLSGSDGLFQCTNYWYNTVNVTVALADGNGLVNSVGGTNATGGTAVAIAPGAIQCLRVNINVGNNATGVTVAYRLSITAADLLATLDFTAPVKTANTPGYTPC